MYTVHYVVRASIFLPLSGPLSQRAIAVLVCVYRLRGCLIKLHNCFRVLLVSYSIWRGGYLDRREMR
jgi:hypothetical protein